MDSPVCIKIENVSKTFRIREKSRSTIRQKVGGFFSTNPLRVIKALDQINLEVRKGEFLGVIGKNGCGKSTLLHIMTGLMPPDKGGSVSIHGNFIRLSLGLGFNRELTARENIYVNASIMGVPFAVIRDREEDILEFAGVRGFTDTKIKYFSKGMKSRLAFSVAIHAEADVFLMDEFFGGVGDQDFMKKSEEVFRRAFIDGRTIVHVSHNLSTIRKFADRAILLDEGRCVAFGNPAEVVEEYIESSSSH